LNEPLLLYKAPICVLGVGERNLDVWCPMKITRVDLRPIMDTVRGREILFLKID